MISQYLIVAGYTFKIFFENSDNTFYRNKWLEYIKKYYGNFIPDLKPKKIDYSIRFVERKTYPIIKKSEKGKKYINYFIDSDHRKATTFYIISIAQFELILMDIVCKLFQNDGGFFIHTSAVYARDGAFLFTGKSHSGKSTIINLLNPAFTPFVDDIGIIRKKNNSYYLYQTPHHEKGDSINKNSSGFLIKKIFFLKKSNINEIKKITSKNEIIQKLTFQVIVYFIQNKFSIKHLLEFIAVFDTYYLLSFNTNR